MATSLRLTLSAIVNNGTYKDQFKPDALEVTLAAVGARKGVQTIGTSAETVTTGDVATLGWCFLQNLDATNFITYGPDSTGQVDFGRLKAGEWAAFRLEPGITLKATADTAACKMAVWILDN